MTSVRTPRIRLLADGSPVAGVRKAEIVSNNHFAADRFTLQLALSANGRGLSAWDMSAATLLEVQMAADMTGGWTTLVSGRIDSLDADVVSGSIRLEGRDLSAGLMEAPIREAFANQTASEIANLIAARRGFASAITATTTPVGRYYSSDHQRLALDRFNRVGSEWELLVWLAQTEGFDVFVFGNTLHFEPVESTSEPTLVLRAIPGPAGPATVMQLHLRRLLTLSGSVSVTVRSWNSQQQQSFAETVSVPNDATATADSREYVYARPNLSADEAKLLASRKLQALTAHQFGLRARMPGELLLRPRDLVLVSGSDSVFDQTYLVEEITRRFEPQTGFTQTVRARTNGYSMMGP